MNVAVTRYHKEHETWWNRFIAASKNGTFLFDRRFMDYHSDRFDDHSLMFHAQGKLVAVFPANLAEGTVVSHGGLSYGGIVTDRRMQAGTMLEIVEQLLDYYRALGMQALIYKAVPHVYHRQPAEEDIYALYRAGAELFRVDMSTTIDLTDPLPMAKGRKCGLSKARKAGVSVQKSEDYAGFWPLLDRVLRERHNVAPVHSLEEMTFLAERFPGRIALYTARIGDELAAGSVVFDTDRVAHVQYMAPSDLGRETGALDAVIHHLTADVYRHRIYLDFGVSTESQGRVLNEGLSRQKEAFGGRGTACLFFKLAL